MKHSSYSTSIYLHWFLTILVLVTLLPLNSQAQVRFMELVSSGRFRLDTASKIGIYGGEQEAQRFYSTAGKEILSPIRGFLRPSSDVGEQYTFRYSASVIGGSTYIPLESILGDSWSQWAAFIDVPFIFAELDEDFVAILGRDSATGFPIIRQENFLTTESAIGYVGIGGWYRFHETEAMQLSLFAAMYLQGNYDSTTIQHRDGELNAELLPQTTQLHVGTEILAPTAFGWVKGDLRYHSRSGGFSDELFLFGEVGIVSIPSMPLTIYGVAVVAMDAYSEQDEFSVVNFSSIENFIRMGATFSFQFTEKFSASIIYSIRLSGENTWGLTQTFGQVLYQL